MSSSESKKFHILVVDDDKMIAKLAARILEDEDYETVVAHNVVEARQKMALMLANGGLHAILTDWDMKPEGNGAGAHVLAAAREAGIHKLAAMSGRLDRDEMDGSVEEMDPLAIRMRESGAKKLLPKPFYPKQLIETILGILGEDSDK